MAEPTRTASANMENAFADLAVTLGFVTLVQVSEVFEAKRKLEEMGVPDELPNIFVKKGLLTPQQVQTCQQKLSANEKKKIIAGFEVIEHVGHGAMGAVYKARQLSMERIVALKVLPPSLAKNKTFKERFIREARASGRLDHLHIVHGIDVGEDRGVTYFAMEFVDGPTVKSVLKKNGALPWREALRIGRQIASALSYAWKAQGLVHRDVKPDNIMLAADGNAKLCDLGLAKETQTAEDSQLTQSGQAVGTPHYISPEQAKGQKDIDTRSDIYGLGATLYHMLTGKVPFEGSNPTAVMVMHVTDQAPGPRQHKPELSEDLERLIAKAMAKDPADRYQEPAEMEADIEALLHDQLPLHASGFRAKSSIIYKPAPMYSSDRAAALANRSGRSSGRFRKSTTGKLEPVQRRATGRQEPLRKRATGRREAVRPRSTEKYPPVQTRTTKKQPPVGVPSRAGAARPSAPLREAPPPRKAAPAKEALDVAARIKTAEQRPIRPDFDPEAMKTTRKHPPVRPKPVSEREPPKVQTPSIPAAAAAPERSGHAPPDAAAKGPPNPKPGAKSQEPSAKRQAPAPAGKGLALAGMLIGFLAVAGGLFWFLGRTSGPRKSAVADASGQHHPSGAVRLPPVKPVAGKTAGAPVTVPKRPPQAVTITPERPPLQPPKRLPAPAPPPAPPPPPKALPPPPDPAAKVAGTIRTKAPRKPPAPPPPSLEKAALLAFDQASRMFKQQHLEKVKPVLEQIQSRYAATQWYNENRALVEAAYFRLRWAGKPWTPLYSVPAIPLDGPAKDRWEWRYDQLTFTGVQRKEWLLMLGTKLSWRAGWWTLSPEGGTPPGLLLGLPLKQVERLEAVFDPAQNADYGWAVFPDQRGHPPLATCWYESDGSIHLWSNGVEKRLKLKEKTAAGPRRMLVQFAPGRAWIHVHGKTESLVLPASPSGRMIPALVANRASVRVGSVRIHGALDPGAAQALQKEVQRNRTLRNQAARLGRHRVKITVSSQYPCGIFVNSTRAKPDTKSGFRPQAYLFTLPASAVITVHQFPPAGKPGGPVLLDVGPQRGRGGHAGSGITPHVWAASAEIGNWQTDLFTSGSWQQVNSKAVPAGIQAKRPPGVHARFVLANNRAVLIRYVFDPADLK